MKIFKEQMDSVLRSGQAFWRSYSALAIRHWWVGVAGWLFYALIAWLALTH